MSPTLLSMWDESAHIGDVRSKVFGDGDHKPQ